MESVAANAQVFKYSLEGLPVTGLKIVAPDF